MLNAALETCSLVVAWLTGLAFDLRFYDYSQRPTWLAVSGEDFLASVRGQIQTIAAAAAAAGAASAASASPAHGSGEVDSGAPRGRGRRRGGPQPVVSEVVADEGGAAAMKKRTERESAEPSSRKQLRRPPKGT